MSHEKLTWQLILLYLSCCCHCAFIQKFLANAKDTNLHVNFIKVVVFAKYVLVHISNIKQSTMIMYCTCRYMFCIYYVICRTWPIAKEQIMCIIDTILQVTYISSKHVEIEKQYRGKSNVFLSYKWKIVCAKKLECQ